MDKIKAKQAFVTAVGHGFLPKIKDTKYALEAINGEMDEAIDCIEKLGVNSSIYNNPICVTILNQEPGEISKHNVETFILPTRECELADVIIRAATQAHYHGTQFNENAATTFIDIKMNKMVSIYDLQVEIKNLVVNCFIWNDVDYVWDIQADNIYLIIKAVESWCGYRKIDIDKFVAIKMNYNKLRPYLHGKA